MTIDIYYSESNMVLFKWGRNQDFVLEYFIIPLVYDHMTSMYYIYKKLFFQIKKSSTINYILIYYIYLL